MKIIGKILILGLSLLILSTPAFAEEGLMEKPTHQPFYYSFTGEVKEVIEDENGYIRVFLENSDGLEANFILSEDTFYLDDVEIKEGNEITGYYQAGKPMILIYPPQYSIDVVTPVYDEGFIKVDKFDSNLLSKDKGLKLNISMDTQVFWPEDESFSWVGDPTVEDIELALANRRLIVLYDITTRSIPPQTTPNKIFVLSQAEIDPIYISVGDTLLEDAPEAYINEENISMVPLRAIGESLGYEVTWDNVERSVQIGDNIYFKIGENNYKFAEEEKELEVAPIIKDDRTFVPLSFFQEIADVIEENIFDHNIIIVARDLVNN